MAVEWLRELDPYDDCEFEMDFNPLLDQGEAVADFNVQLTAEALAEGLLLGAAGEAPFEVEPGVVRLRLSIDPAKRDAAALQGNGALMGVSGSIVTDAVPPRAFRREWQVRVKPL